MQQIRGARRIKTILSILTITLSLIFILSGHAQQVSNVSIRVTATDESEKPVAGVVVELKLKGKLVSTSATDEKGEAEFANLLPGTYEVIVSKDTFETLNQNDVVLTSGAPIEVKFTMIPKVQLEDQVVNVKAGSESPLERVPRRRLRSVELKSRIFPRS